MILRKNSRKYGNQIQTQDPEIKGYELKDEDGETVELSKNQVSRILTFEG